MIKHFFRLLAYYAVNLLLFMIPYVVILLWLADLFGDTDLLNGIFAMIFLAFLILNANATKHQAVTGTGFINGWKVCFLEVKGYMELLAGK